MYIRTHSTRVYTGPLIHGHLLCCRDSKIVRNVMHSAFIVVFMSSFWRGNSVLGYFFPLLGAFFASMIGLQTSVLGGLQMYFFGMAYADIFAYSVVWCLIFGAGYVGIYRYGKVSSCSLCFSILSRFSHRCSAAFKYTSLASFTPPNFYDCILVIFLFFWR